MISNINKEFMSFKYSIYAIFIFLWKIDKIKLRQSNSIVSMIV